MIKIFALSTLILFSANLKAADLDDNLFVDEKKKAPTATKANRSPDALEQAKDDYKVVEPVQKNTIPSSKYENYENEPVRMPHPGAAKGLQRITSDKVYIYSTGESEQSNTTSVLFGLFNPTDLTNGQSGAEEVTFSEVYGSEEVPIITLDFDWKFSEKFGRLNYQLGTGVFIANGNGRFKNDPVNPAREKFDFFAIPITGNVVYRAHYWHKQWLVPYFGGGAGIMGFVEVRDDDQGPKLGGAPFAQGYGGASLSIMSLASDKSIALDREYGINNMWVNVEYRLLYGLSDKFDFSGDFLNVGFSVDY